MSRAALSAALICARTGAGVAAGAAHGAGWGDQGYGFVSFQYIRDYSNDAIAIEEKE